MWQLATYFAVPYIRGIGPRTRDLAAAKGPPGIPAGPSAKPFAIAPLPSTAAPIAKAAGNASAGPGVAAKDRIAKPPLPHAPHDRRFHSRRASLVPRIPVGLLASAFLSWLTAPAVLLPTHALIAGGCAGTFMAAASSGLYGGTFWELYVGSSTVNVFVRG